MIKPTIGRRVWFRPHQDDLSYMRQLDSTQAFDAGIIYVHDDRLVGLLITDHSGLQHIRTAVALRQEGDEVPHGGHAEWMPYQMAQAR